MFQIKLLVELGKEKNMLKKKFSGIIFSIIIISIILMTLSLLSCKCNEFKENLIMLEGLIMFLFSMLQTLIIALLIDKELVKHRSLTEKALDLEEKGITGVNKNGVLTSEEINDLFNNAEIIKLMFVTGNSFLTKYKTTIEKAIKKGGKNYVKTQKSVTLRHRRCGGGGGCHRRYARLFARR